MNFTVSHPVERTPLGHRVARAMAKAGVRRSPLYWAVAQTVHASPTVVSTQIGAGRLSLNRADPMERAMFEGTFERAEGKIISLLAAPGANCVDVGANVGFHTLLMAARVGRTGRVLAMEPAPMTYQRLCAHTREAPQVTPVAVAAGAGVGEATLSIWENNSGLATMSNHGWTDATNTVQVPVTTIDRLMAEHGMCEVALLKVDAEGVEADVLRGASNSLADHMIAAVMVEANPQWGTVVPMLKLLRDYQYRLYEIYESKSKSRLRLISRVRRVPEGAIMHRQMNLVAVRPLEVSAYERRLGAMIDGA